MMMRSIFTWLFELFIARPRRSADSPPPKEQFSRPEEKAVVRAARKGSLADFSEWDGEVVLRASFLRRLLCLRHPFVEDETTRAGRAAPFRIWIRKARIEGVLDLRDSSGPEGLGCPSLILERCQLIGKPPYDDPASRPEPAINAEHAKLSRLELKDCEIGYLELSGADLLGNLKLTRIRSPAVHGQCWVRARGLRVRGSISISDSVLRVRQEDAEPPEWKPKDAALDLSGAEIDGSLLLRPGFVADGGVKLGNARIRGDFRADGALLIAAKNDALDAQTMRVEGQVILRCMEREGTVERFEAQGKVSFYGAEFRGSLDMSGARLVADKEQGECLVLALTKIGGAFFLRKWQSVPFEAEGRLAFWQTRVVGDLIVKGEVDDFIAFHARFESNATLKNIQNELVLTGCSVGGDLRINQGGGRLIAPALTVQGNTSIGGRFRERIVLRDSDLIGHLKLVADLVQSPSAKQLLASKGASESSDIDLAKARIGGDLTLGRVESVDDEDWTKAFSRRKMRSHSLSFYVGWRLAECLGYLPHHGKIFLLSFLYHTDRHEVVLLNNTDEPIRRFNTHRALDLGKDEQRKEYLRFFCAYSWGDEGSFKIVESIDDIPAEQRSGIQFAGPPFDHSSLEFELNAISGEKGSWRARGVTILNDSQLRSATLVLQSDGQVERLDDEPIAPLRSRQRARYLASARVLRAGENPMEWPEEPPVAGEWSELKEPLSEELFERLCEVADSSRIANSWTEALFVRIRERDIVFYPEWWLGECLCVLPSGNYLALLSFLHHRERPEMVILSGDATHIYQLNQRGALRLTTDEQRADYLRFFCSHIWGTPDSFKLGGDSFKIIEAVGQLPQGHVPENLELVELKLCEDPPANTGTQTTEEGTATSSPSWSAPVVISYYNSLFEAKLKLFADGRVKMVDDEPVAQAAPAIFPEHLKPMRLFQVSALSDDKETASEWPTPPLLGEAEAWTTLIDYAAAELFELLLVAGPARPEPLPTSADYRPLAKSPPKQAVKIDLGRCKAGAFLPDWQGGGEYLWREQIRPVLDDFDYGWIDPIENYIKGPTVQRSRTGERDARPSGKMQASEAFKKQLEGLLGAKSHNTKSGKKTFWKRLYDWLNSSPKKRPRPTVSWDQLLGWLKSRPEEETPRSGRDPYNPQPFEHLAAVLRKQGREDIARNIIREKLRLERLRPLRPERRYLEWWVIKPLSSVFDFFFAHGLSTLRGFVTFLFCWFAGTLLFDSINYGQMRFLPFGKPASITTPHEPPILVVNVAAITAIDGWPDLPPPGTMPLGLAEEVACEDRIEASIYALDVFVPLLDLNHEERCSISTRPHGLGWRLVVAFYRVLGWIVTSLLVLTLTGTLRKRFEG